MIRIQNLILKFQAFTHPGLLPFIPADSWAGFGQHRTRPEEEQHCHLKTHLSAESAHLYFGSRTYFAGTPTR